MSICVIFFFLLLVFSVMLLMLSCYFIYSLETFYFEIELLMINSSKLIMIIYMDWMSGMFLFLVTFISSLVIYYSWGYMKSEKYLDRFIMTVLLFVMSMGILIVSPNLISILLGWDGLGLVSYCLVIYYQNVKSYNAGMLTALANRVGDAMILVGIVWMMNFGSWNFIFYLEIIKNSGYSSIIGTLIFIAAITKSAQIPFSMWLPAAMAAPTPVSALVHSSTLVTAGVYLLIRFNYLIYHTNVAKIMMFLGGLTTIMAGLGANFEFDLKKIIALSTLSQLGFMMMILSVGQLTLTFFHLMTHALFKALLFMCAGVIIHMVENFQDIRYMGGLLLQMPMTAMSLNLANMALCGVPFLAGFYSKDLILEMSSFIDFSLMSYFIYFFSTGLTACYSIRLVYYLFFMTYMSWNFHNYEDSYSPMILGMMGLLFMSLSGGAMLMWLLFPCPWFLFLPFYMKILPIVVCLMGGMAGYLCSTWCIYYESKSLILYKLSSFLGLMWFMSFLATSYIIFFIMKISAYVFEVIDAGWFEMLNNKMFMSMMKMSKWMQKLLINNLKTFLSLTHLFNLFLVVMVFLF